MEAMDPSSTPAGHRASRGQRGFTLLELVVGAAVTALVLVGIAAAIIGTQASFQGESTIKQAVEGSRLATGYLERLLPLAGYGLDPRFAFDFAVAAIPGNEKDNRFESWGSGPPDQFTTDDLAFRHRDPAYLRRGTLNPAGTTLTLNVADFPDFGSALSPGQAIIVACQGASSWRVMRLTAGAAATATSATVADYGAPFTGGSFPVGVPSCYQDAAKPALVMLMYETRIRVINLNNTPVLVAFHDFQNITGNTNYDPLVANVEVFQVTYVMNQPRPTSGCCALAPLGSWTPAGNAPDAAGSQNWVMGDTGDPVGTLPDPAVVAPQSSTAYDDALRYNAHPANIRAIRLSIVVRSPRPRDKIAFPYQTGEQIGNYTVPALTDSFYRAVTTATVRTPNMASRAFFNPPLNAAGGTANVWGG